MRNTLLLILLASATQSLYASEPMPRISDGPYIDVHDTRLQVNWICDDRVSRETMEFSSQTTTTVQKCGLDATVHHINFEEHAIQFTGVKKIAALSDLHGQFELMRTLLRNNRIINEQNQWAFGDGHFVITGDIFDRGDKVTEILWFIYDLEQQAERAGGKLHLLLGNHEVMVMNGDLRYLHPKYVKTQQLLEKPFEQLFTKQTILGRWLRAKPVLVKINHYLFAHGGFHPSLATDKLTLERINSTFKSNLVEKELDQNRNGLGLYLHKTHGPIWYRGYFKDDGATSQEIDLLLSHFDVNHLVVGHTSQKQIETRYQGKVIAIDSSIKNGKYGEILFIENNKHTRGTLKGERHEL
ncbi:Protein-tyrosine-phosphatase [Pseudoalteromonas luteoviolacea B = ATCC 29581]|nr:Protein-tyrosine-phosphatase [Pseudoalteromonas luteoviolacea B = ATCC 29581]